MFYDAELAYLAKVLRKYHVQILQLHPKDVPDYRVDMGLRKSLGREQEYRRLRTETENWLVPNTIFKLTDSFMCSYVFLLLPETEEPSHLVIGPYLSKEPDNKRLLEILESQGIAPSRLKQLQSYYESIPCFPEDYILFHLITAFGETIWGGSEAFRIEDISREARTAFHPLPGGDREGTQPEETLLAMQVMEARYAFENELLQAVTQGQIHRAEQIFDGLIQNMSEQRQSLQRRDADPVRNLKNYCIIMNTLLRKAAENGGVHPVYLDSISSDFAVRIEGLRTVAAGGEMMREILQSYCRLVRKHATRSYSPQVQKAIAYIDSDLSEDLSLRALAGMQGVSASYLSTLFRKETGQTLTEHVSLKRMALAMRLLNTTRLQIQTIAQHCGFSDVNYFSKTFKKYLGVTPREYRETSAATYL